MIENLLLVKYYNYTLGDPGNQNVCYYSNTACCSPLIDPQLSSCNSSSTLLVAGTEVQVNFLNLYIPGNIGKIVIAVL